MCPSLPGLGSSAPPVGLNGTRAYLLWSFPCRIEWGHRAGWSSGRRKAGSSQKEETVTAEVPDKFSELITTALGLVAALAWNAAIQQLFTQLFGEAGGALVAKFFYAILVTLIVIFATISVGRAAERAKKLEAERDKGLLGLGRSKE